MVFTFVSSFIVSLLDFIPHQARSLTTVQLPLSFFTSVFGMNVAELNDEDNPVTLWMAMAYIGMHHSVPYIVSDVGSPLS